MMSRRSIFLSVLLVSLSVLLPIGCSSTRSTSFWSGQGTQRGQASWYGGKFHGRKTASGEIYDQNRMTAAHRNLPFGTMVQVKNLKNGKTTTVCINDRGPFVSGRIIDLSRAAAIEVDMIQDGVVPVEVVVVR